MQLLTNDCSWCLENNNINDKTVKELGENISQLTNLTQLDLNLEG